MNDAKETDAGLTFSLTLYLFQMIRKNGEDGISQKAFLLSLAANCP
jgi:hypothetical protein